MDVEREQGGEASAAEEERGGGDSGGVGAWWGLCRPLGSLSGLLGSSPLTAEATELSAVESLAGDSAAGESKGGAGGRRVRLSTAELVYP